MEYIDHYDSPLGVITLVSDGENLTGLSFENHRYSERAPGDSALAEPEDEAARPVFDGAKRWLDLYFQGIEPDFTPPVRIIGSDFRKMVCEIVRGIPYGQTMTYGEIAAVIARRRGIAKMSAQAVGGAVGHNPVSIIIPCHRVVGANGSLTGYGGGTARKAALLELEKTGPRQPICQCCGMPLSEDGLISKEPDGSFNEAYCKWCYAVGISETF